MKRIMDKVKYKVIGKKIIILPLILCVCLIVTGFNNLNASKNRQFKDHVVFYPQHQDDEVLWAGSAIVEAINQCGRDNVYIVQVSTGTGISVFEKDDKYKHLTNEEKTELRQNEFLASVKALGVKEENVIILPEISKLGYTDFNLMERVALEFEENLKSVTHVAHTYKLDNHLQHIKNGSIIQGLYNTGKIQDAKYFVKPQFEHNIDYGKKIIYKASSTEDYNKVKEACEQYKIIDEENNREGIGYKSDHKSFDRLINKKTAPAILHTPTL